MVEVTDLGVLVDYLTSVTDHDEGQVSGWSCWKDVLAVGSRRAAAEIGQRGWFGISTSMGVFMSR
jgi:hypothetical protein